MVEKSAVAIIPARGGSKRIPHKNIIDFFGKPLIEHTIHAALDSGMFTDVVVSTDDQAIADVAVAAGATVPFMRDSFTDDHSPISQATVWTIQELEKRNAQQYQVVCQLMANCPLRTADTITRAVQAFIDRQVQFQISACTYGWLNPWWAHQQVENSTAWEAVFPDQLKQRSQDQPSVLCPTGAIWLADVQGLLKHKTFYGPNYSMFEIDWKEAVDIDNYEDLEMARVIYTMQEQSTSNAANK